MTPPAPRYVLDTDTLTLFRRGHPRIEPRVLAHPAGVVVTSVITAEEQLTGWYSALRKATTPDRLALAYARLADTISFFAGFPVVSMDRPAIDRYDALRAAKINVKKLDLRIAAIALETGLVVVTCNVRDFGRVPGLTVEDWSVP